MGKTSNEAKARYNKKTYKSWAANIRPELWERIEVYTAAHGMSKKDFLEIAIERMEKED